MEGPEDPAKRACRTKRSYAEDQGDGGAGGKKGKKKAEWVPIHSLLLSALDHDSLSCVCTLRDMLDFMGFEELKPEDLKFVQIPSKGYAASAVMAHVRREYKNHSCNQIVVPRLLDGLITLHEGNGYAALFWNDGAGVYERFPCVQKSGKPGSKRPWLMSRTANVMYNRKADRHQDALAQEPTALRPQRLTSTGETCPDISPLSMTYAISGRVTGVRQPFLLGVSDESSEEEQGTDVEAEQALADDEDDPVVDDELVGQQARQVSQQYEALPEREKTYFQQMQRLYPRGEGPCPRVGQARAAALMRRGHAVLKGARVVLDRPDEPVPALDIDFEALSRSIGVGPEFLAEMHVVVAALNCLIPRGELRRVAGAGRIQGADLSVDAAHDETRLVPHCFKRITERYGVEAGTLGVLLTFFGDRLPVAWLALVAFSRTMDERGLTRRSPREQRWACWMSAGEYLLKFRPVLMDGGLVDIGFGLSYGRDRSRWFGNLLAGLEGMRQTQLFRTLAHAWMARLEDDNCLEGMARFGLSFIAALFVGQERQVTFVSAERFLAEFDADSSGIVLPGFFMDTERVVLDPQQRKKFSLECLPEYTGLVPFETLLGSMGHVDASAACVGNAIRHLDAGDELELAITASGQYILAVRSHPPPVAARPAPAQASDPAPAQDSGVVPDFARLAKDMMQASSGGRGKKAGSSTKAKAGSDKKAGSGKKAKAGRDKKAGSDKKAKAGSCRKADTAEGEAAAGLDFAEIARSMQADRLRRLREVVRAHLELDGEPDPA